MFVYLCVSSSRDGATHVNTMGRAGGPERRREARESASLLPAPVPRRPQGRGRAGWAGPGQGAALPRDPVRHVCCPVEFFLCFFCYLGRRLETLARC